MFLYLYQPNWFMESTQTFFSLDPHPFINHLDLLSPFTVFLRSGNNTLFRGI